MCIGVPYQITDVSPNSCDIVLACIDGVTREVNVSLLKTIDCTINFVGKWVLVHAGFALNFLEEKEALMILDALKQMEALEPDVSHLLYGESSA